MSQQHRAGIALLFALIALSACSRDLETDFELKSILIDAEGLIPASEAFYRSEDIKFVCIGSGNVRPDDHIAALQAQGYFEVPPMGDAYESKANIGEFTYDITVFSETTFQVYPINARDLGWPHASVGCYHGATAQIGLMDTGSGLRVATTGQRVYERRYWRE